MDKLRLINLEKSWNLKSTPDLTWTPNLRTLILVKCINLEKVHPSLADHQQLVFLSLSGCSKLESLPSPLRMRSLEILDLNGCFHLKRFPEIASGKMEKLLELRLKETVRLRELPPSIGNLSGLAVLDLQFHLCICLPSTICCLKYLKTLDVSFCSLEQLPENLGQLESLENLFIERNIAIREAPSSIVHLTKLKTLSVCNCQELAASLLMLLSGRTYSNSTTTLGLEQRPPPLLGFGSIKKLSLQNCSLAERDIPGDLSPLFTLEELDLSENLFRRLPSSICQLPRLKFLNLYECKDLQELQELPPSIVVLHLSHGGATKSLPDLLPKYESLWNIVGFYARGIAITDEELFLDLVMQSLLQGPLVANHRLSISFMSTRNIPKWFSRQNPGNSETHLQLSSNWSNKSLLGFAVSAVYVNWYRSSSITFDLLEERIENVNRDWKPESTHWPKDSFTWLGFFSVSFFQLLFPDFKPDDWSNFKGSVRASFSRNQCVECAMRPVYEEDMKGMSVSTIQNSLVLNDPMGRPWINHGHMNLVKDVHHHARWCPSTTVDLKETGRTHAVIRSVV